MGIEFCDTSYVKFGVASRADDPQSAILGVDFVIPLNTGNCVKRVESLREEIIRSKQLENRASEIGILTGVYQLCADPQYATLELCRDVSVSGLLK